MKEAKTEKKAEEVGYKIFSTIPGAP